MTTNAIVIRYGTAGFGDVLQSLQILPEYTIPYDKVVVVVRPELQKFVSYNLLGDKYHVKTYFPEGELPERIPFPSRDELRAASPSGYPFLSAVPGWPYHLDDDYFHIGFAWGTAEDQLHISNRAAAPETLVAPLLRVPYVQLHHIQAGRNEHLKSWPRVKTYNFVDFADSSRLVEKMNCVVTVDTALAHLAAGMGKRTYVLLSNRSAGRYYDSSSDRSYWYHTMRLVRTRGGPKTERDPNQLADSVQQVVEALGGDAP